MGMHRRNWIGADERSKEGVEPGFTLIELLVVVLIVGVLAAIAMPVLLGQQTKAYRDAVMSDVRNAALVLEDYYAANTAFPPVGPVPGFVGSNDVMLEIKASNAVGYCVQGHHAGLDEDGNGVPDPFYFETRTLKSMTTVESGVCA